MVVTYGLNSLPMFFTSLPLLYAALVFGILVLIHSFVMHGKKFKTVRIISDVAALSLVLESICFIIIMQNPSPSLAEQVALLDVIGNSVFGAIIVACDNYLTFTRYQAVAGGTSRPHKIIALIYVICVNFLTWWEFFTFLPIFWNMNGTTWVIAEYYLGVWVNFIGYIAYDGFYSGMVIYLLVKHVRGSSVNNKKGGAQLTILAGNALGHTILSMLGIFSYAFLFPLGIIIQNMLVVLGIHFFLNFSLLRFLSNDPQYRLSGVTSAGGGNDKSSVGGGKRSSNKVVPVQVSVSRQSNVTNVASRNSHASVGEVEGSDAFSEHD